MTDPDQRQDPELRSRFDKAVIAAAEIAAQKIAQIHRRRLVTQVAAATAVVMATLGVIGLVAVNSSERSFSRKNAIYDCNLFKNGASILGDFVQSDAQLRDRQNRQALGGELSKDFQKIIKHSTLVQLAAQQHRDVARVVTRWYADASQLKGLAGTDCASHLGG